MIFVFGGPDFFDVCMVGFQYGILFEQTQGTHFAYLTFSSWCVIISSTQAIYYYN